MTRIIILCVSLLVAAGCSRSTKPAREAVDSKVRDKAIVVAQHFIDIKHPTWRTSHPWDVWRVQDKLCVAEHLPKDTIGGGTVVVLDARTFEIVDAWHFQ